MTTSAPRGRNVGLNAGQRTPAQLDTRGGLIDEKLKRLDTELLKHREAMKKLRPGPGLVRPELPPVPTKPKPCLPL